MTEKQRFEVLLRTVNNVFFSTDFKPERFISNLVELSGLDKVKVDSFLKKEWDKKNKEIEKVVYSSYASKVSKKELKQILSNYQKDMSGVFKVVPSLKNLSGEDFESAFPVYKYLHYHDVFVERLSGVDLRRIDPNSERIIVKSLQQKMSDLSAKEIMLFYNLAKANLIDLCERRASKTVQERDNDAETHAEMFVDGVFKYITEPFIADLNDGVEIKKDDIKKLAVTLIKRDKFNVKPYIIMFSGERGGKMSQNFISIKEPVSEFGVDSDKIFYYALLRILFKKAKNDDLKLLNLKPSLVGFLRNKPGYLSEEEIGVSVVYESFMFALCSQIYDVNTKYHASDDDRKRKLENLYKDSDRLGMIVVNSLSKGFEEANSSTFDEAKFQKIIVNFISKHSDFIVYEDLFTPFYNF